METGTKDTSDESFALLAWLPIVLWAFLNDRLLDAATGEPLLKHFGIHVLCLVAIPLFILSEAMAGSVLRGIIGQFRKSNIISDNQQAAFASVLTDLARLRDASLPWICVIGFAIAWIVGMPVHSDADEMSWATAGNDICNHT